VLLNIIALYLDSFLDSLSVPRLVPQNGSYLAVEPIATVPITLFRPRKNQVLKLEFRLDK